jgi:hypothetical protein
MALYGIAGLTPSRTMVNADASRVRTVYTVGTAEVVLLQEKQPPARDSTPNETVWSAVVGDVIITIRGTDAAALGARVRVD